MGLSFATVFSAALPGAQFPPEPIQCLWRSLWLAGSLVRHFSSFCHITLKGGSLPRDHGLSRGVVLSEAFSSQLSSEPSWNGQGGRPESSTEGQFLHPRPCCQRVLRTRKPGSSLTQAASPRPVRGAQSTFTLDLTGCPDFPFGNLPYPAKGGTPGS